jgi:hypothetical protein
MDLMLKFVEHQLYFQNKITIMQQEGPTKALLQNTKNVYASNE